MSKYYSSILEIICGNFCRNFCNHFFRWSFELAEQGKKKKNVFVFAMGAGILKLSLGECYLPTLAARFGCTPATSSIWTVNIPCSTIVRVTKPRLLENGKEHSPELHWKKKYSLECMYTCIQMILEQQSICQAAKACCWQLVILLLRNNKFEL